MTDFLIYKWHLNCCFCSFFATVRSKCWADLRTEKKALDLHSGWHSGTGYWRTFQTEVRVSNKSHETTILRRTFPQTGLYFRCVFDSHTFIRHIKVFSETSERSDFPKNTFRRTATPRSIWNCGGNQGSTAGLHFQIIKPERSLESCLIDTKTNLWWRSFTACVMYLKTILVFGTGWCVLLLDSV